MRGASQGVISPARVTEQSAGAKNSITRLAQSHFSEVWSLKAPCCCHIAPAFILCEQSLLYDNACGHLNAKRGICY